MRRTLWLVVLSVVSDVWGAPSAALAGPMRCDVAERSAAGGVVEVKTDDTPAPDWAPTSIKRSIKRHVVWMPPPSPHSPRMVVTYVGATSLELGNEPSGGYIRFRISPPNAADDTRVVLNLPDGQTFTLQGEDLQYGHDFGSDDETRPAVDVAFASPDALWPKIRSALAERGRLGVKLVRNGKILEQAVFDFSNWEARDALLVRALRKVEASDPHVCTDAPRPVMRWF